MYSHFSVIFIFPGCIDCLGNAQGADTWVTCQLRVTSAVHLPVVDHLHVQGALLLDMEENLCIKSIIEKTRTAFRAARRPRRRAIW